MPSISFLAAQQAVVLGVGVALLRLRVAHPGPLLAAEAAWVAFLLALGTALATVVRSQAELGAAQDVGGLVLTGAGRSSRSPFCPMPSNGSLGCLLATGSPRV